MLRLLLSRSFERIVYPPIPAEIRPPLPPQSAKVNGVPARLEPIGLSRFLLFLLPTDLQPLHISGDGLPSDLLSQAVPKFIQQGVPVSLLSGSQVSGKLSRQANLLRGSKKLKVNHRLFNFVCNFVKARMVVCL